MIRLSTGFGTDKLPMRLEFITGFFMRLNT